MLSLKTDFIFVKSEIVLNFNEKEIVMTKNIFVAKRDIRTDPFGPPQLKMLSTRIPISRDAVFLPEQPASSFVNSG